ncbi:MAG: ABC transporter ATP-binding protein [Nitrospirae bacterium]|nr:ABC transporter ATP-binding protein [Nitrospirota bacterium]
MSMIAIDVANLTKIYRLYRSPKDRLRELVSLKGEKFHHDFHALNDVSFKVEKGETVGIIGQNGSGKSTLLKIISGVVRPTSGRVTVKGRISSLLELGAGFHPEFSGRNNVYMNGALMGVSREEMDRRFPEIEAFADIGEFIDQPVKCYSSGMYVRLAFAAAVNVEPEILIVDEALSVGDVLFQAKCFAKFLEFKEKGITIIFVTHTLDLVTTHCSRALLLDRGVLVQDGRPKSVVDTSNRCMTSGRIGTRVREIGNEWATHSGRQPTAGEIVWQERFRLNPDEDRYGTRQAEILEAGLFTPEDTPVQILDRNREYLIKIKVRYHEPMPAGIVGYLIKDPKGTIVCGTNTAFQNVAMGSMVKGEVIIVTFRQIIRLNAGGYLLCVGSTAFDQGTYVVYDRRFDYLAFEVVGEEQRLGIFDPESTVEWVRCG